MPRVRTGTVRRKKHKKILKATKGYYGTRSKLFRRANEAYIKAGEHAFVGRKLRKRDMKKLWIIRLNASLKLLGYKYSDFFHSLRNSKIELDRKVLSELAMSKPEAFKAVVEKIMKK